MKKAVSSEPSSAVDPPEPYVSALVRDLCQALADADIRYCHWKSNNALDRSASGENDLDLLVDRDQLSDFCAIVFRLGFKQALAPADKQMPGVQEFFAYDADAERFIHVQAHYQLILGHDRTKNVVLPIADAYLASAGQQGLFRVPAVEHEYAVLAIRLTLKYATWDAILGGQGRPKPSERAELEQLSARVDPKRLGELAAGPLGFVGEPLLQNCIRAADGRGFFSRILTAHRLQRRLRPHARRGMLTDTYLRLWRRLALGLRRRIRGAPGKYRLAGGGTLIAIMGGDGAGKTTAIAELHRWLAAHFDVRGLHMGKPHWSKSTYLVRGLSKLLHLGLTRVLRRPPLSEEQEEAGYRRLLWYACTARDRYLCYIRARRFTLGGGVMICDRYPNEHIKLMDGPLIAHLRGERGGRLWGALARLESRYHRAILAPDLLMVLKVDPEIAVRRKTDEDSDMVRLRSTEVWRLDWDRVPEALVIDAAQDREQVLRELKARVWSRL